MNTDDGEKNTSIRKFEPGWIMAAIAFALGILANSLDLTGKIYDFCCAPSSRLPLITASYVAMPIDLISGDSGSFSDLQKIANLKILETPILKAAKADDVDYDALLLSLANGRLSQEFDCKRSNDDEIMWSGSQCIRHYELYVVGVLIKIQGDVPVLEGNLHGELFELDRKPKEIYQFNYDYEIIEDKCLYDYKGGDCVLEVGSVRPKPFQVQLPDISKNESIFVPISMVATPDIQIAEFYLHYLVGPAVLPKEFEYLYGDNEKGLLKVRSMINNMFQLNFDQKVYGLG
jgi:hypothetical protein